MHLVVDFLRKRELSFGSLGNSVSEPFKKSMRACAVADDRPGVAAGSQTPLHLATLMGVHCPCEGECFFGDCASAPNRLVKRRLKQAILLDAGNLLTPSLAVSIYYLCPAFVQRLAEGAEVREERERCAEIDHRALLSAETFVGSQPIQ
jgi:hypothetical protein